MSSLFRNLFKLTFNSLYRSILDLLHRNSTLDENAVILISFGGILISSFFFLFSVIYGTHHCKNDELDNAASLGVSLLPSGKSTYVRHAAVKQMIDYTVC